VAAVRAAAPGANAVADIMEFYCGTYYRFAGADKPGAPLHDPCAIAYLIDPTMFEIAQLPGDVIVGDDASYGQTLIDIRPQDPSHDQRIKNVGVAMKADAERFAALVTQALIWAALR
jgi:inosine-uridine nucleoside N-ribohydrolase